MTAPSGNLLRRYVPGPDGTPLLWYEGSGLGDRRWLIKDQRGSVVAVANASGQTLALNTYDGYGLGGSSNLGRFQYAGRPFIPEVGLYDNAARSYSPTLGRFLQTDPIGYGDGLNWYAYAHGDPVNGTDPSGLDNEGGDDPCEYDACAQDGGDGDNDFSAYPLGSCGGPFGGDDYGAQGDHCGGVTLTGNYGAFLLSSPGGPGNSRGGGARGGMPAPQGKQNPPNIACKAAAVFNHAAELYERDALAFSIAAKVADGASFTPAAGFSIPAAATAEGLSATYALASFVSSVGAGVLSGLATGNYQSLANSVIGFGLGKASGLNGVAAEASSLATGAIADAASPNPC